MSSSRRSGHFNVTLVYLLQSCYSLDSWWFILWECGEFIKSLGCIRISWIAKKKKSRIH